MVGSDTGERQSGRVRTLFLFTGDLYGTRADFRMRQDPGRFEISVLYWRSRGGAPITV